MISKKIMAVGVGVVALGLTLTIAGPASAVRELQTRTLPAGETLFGIDCQTNTGQLASVEPLTAVATAVGAGSTDSHVGCAADATYDSTTGKIFWAARQSGGQLFSMDPATGDSTYIAPLTFDTADNTLGALMMGTDGILYALYNYDNGDDPAQEKLGTVDTTSGTVTFTHDLSLDSSPFADSTYGADFNPADGKFYMVESRELYEVDVATGALTDKGRSPNGWQGIAFDSTGVIWSSQSEVYSSTVDAWVDDQKTDNSTTLDGSDWYNLSAVIVPASAPTPPPTEEPTTDPTDGTALAQTGFDGAQGGILSAGGAALALLGAGVILAARRRKVTG